MVVKQWMPQLEPEMKGVMTKTRRSIKMKVTVTIDSPSRAWHITIVVCAAAAQLGWVNLVTTLPDSRFVSHERRVLFQKAALPFLLQRLLF